MLKSIKSKPFGLLAAAYGCIRLHTATYGRWRGIEVNTFAYGRWRGIGLHTAAGAGYGCIRLHTVIYGRFAGYGFIRLYAAADAEYGYIRPLRGIFVGFFG